MRAQPMALIHVVDQLPAMAGLGKMYGKTLRLQGLTISVILIHCSRIKSKECVGQKGRPYRLPGYLKCRLLSPNPH